MTKIDDRAFSKCTNLKSIIIPNNVKSIGDGAFAGCTRLTKVSFGEKVAVIGKEAFSGCTELTDIEIPNSVERIEERAFYKCKSLESITIPKNVLRIGEEALSGCTGLKIITVDINNSKYDSRNSCNAIIKTSSNALISGCKSTIIPTNVKSICKSAFSSCLTLTTINIPNSVNKIEDRAFYECKSLTSIKIPNNVTSIGSEAFAWCTGITSVTIPDKVKKIGINAFAHIDILAFIQILANKLDCQYSLRKDQNMQNRMEYFIPYGTIYREEKPFVIIEDTNTKNGEQNGNDTSELTKIQDFLGISWSIRFDINKIHLRPLYGDFKPIEDVFKIINIILNDLPSLDQMLPIEYYLSEIRKMILEYLDNISKKDSLYEFRKESLSKFVNRLDLNDIERKKDGIYLTNAKETEFFKSLLAPADNKELWRYTTRNSLFLTLKNHSQNMLSLNCMNDISEIDYADKYIDKKTCFLRNGINEANKVFILSCCDETKSDDLMMWRLYAQDGEGVSICYHLDLDIDNDFFYLAYISYGEHDSHPELDFLKKMMSWPITPHFRFHKWNVWKHFFKPYEFNYEKEIRLIYYEYKEIISNDNKNKTNETIWIEDNKSGIASPMKVFDLIKKPKALQPQIPLSLIKVLIGPKSKEAEVNRIQFRKLFNETNKSNKTIFPEISISKIGIYR